MKLYVLSRGRRKSKLDPIMIDSKKKCENYQKALKSSDVKSWHYSLDLAPAGAKVWRKHNNYGKWTSYNSPHVPLVK